MEKDINYLQYDSPFDVEIEEYWIDAADRNDRPYRKRCIRYSDPTFSIFNPKLTEDEKNVLATSLETLGSFEGLENFEWLSDLKERLDIEDHAPVISFSKNLLANSTLIARLFTAIRMKKAITLLYHTFDREEKRNTEVIPRLLKEYNNRWYLIASACNSGRLLTFALDRIDDFSENQVRPYIPMAENPEERFEEIIGVTFNENVPLEEIVFWISDKSRKYIITKPIHGSQTAIRSERAQNLRAEYPMLQGGAFFRLKCRENYELIRELTSFGPELVVLSPRHITERIRTRMEEMQIRYQSLPAAGVGSQR
ncbi:MAG: WYL domain-containing protein [Muribaculaceae bacterium]|nr:WYL domain-containing protein [Muribaculaceae bacterium]